MGLVVARTAGTADSRDVDGLERRRSSSAGRRGQLPGAAARLRRDHPARRGHNRVVEGAGAHARQPNKVMVREGTLGTPASMLPMLRLLVAFKPPNHVRLMLHGGDQPLLDAPIPEPLADVGQIGQRSGVLCHAVGQCGRVFAAGDLDLECQAALSSSADLRWARSSTRGASSVPNPARASR